MITRIYSIYDVKVGAYLPPVFMQTNPQVIRAIGDCVNDPKHQFHNHPEDYTLFELGFLDDEHAKFTMLDAPVPIAKLIELKNGASS